MSLFLTLALKALAAEPAEATPAEEPAPTPLASSVLPGAVLPEARFVTVEGLGAATTSTVCVEPALEGEGVYEGACSDCLDLGGGPGLRVQAPLTERTSLELRGAWLRGDGESFPLLGASVKGTLVEGPRFTLTPWAAAMVVPEASNALVAAGVSVDAGSPTLRVDASVPLMLQPLRGDSNVPLGYVPLFSELGVRWHLPGGKHTLRAGLFSIAPGVGWQARLGESTLEAAVHSFEGTTLGRVGLTRGF